MTIKAKKRFKSWKLSKKYEIASNQLIFPDYYVELRDFLCNVRNFNASNTSGKILIKGIDGDGNIINGYFSYVKDNIGLVKLFDEFGVEYKIVYSADVFNLKYNSFYFLPRWKNIVLYIEDDKYTRRKDLLVDLQKSIIERKTIKIKGKSLEVRFIPYDFFIFLGELYILGFNEDNFDDPEVFVVELKDDKKVKE